MRNELFRLFFNKQSEEPRHKLQLIFLTPNTLVIKQPTACSHAVTCIRVEIAFAIF